MMMTLSKWKIWLGLVILFLSGVLVGGFGTRLYVRHRIANVLTGDRPMFRNLFLRHITRELDLTPEQQEQIERIAEGTAEDLHLLHRQHRSAVEAIFDQAVSDMKVYLSPDQQKQLDAVREKMKAFRRRHRHRPPHHGPPPPPPGSRKGPPPFSPP